MFERLKQAFSDKFGGVDTSSILHVGASAPLQPPNASIALRDSLFGDTPLPALLAGISPTASNAAPWSTFALAQAAIAAGREGDGIPLLQSLTSGDQESRVELLAWAALRRLGVHPPPERAKQVLGVVVEVPVQTGLDCVAAYPEQTARYYNHSGAAIIWEAHDHRLDARIDALLTAGQHIANAIGPWQQDRPAAPANGRARINVLTPSGLHFGEGPLEVFLKDSMAGPAIQAAFSLMQALIAEQQQASSAA